VICALLLLRKAEDLEDDSPEGVVKISGGRSAARSGAVFGLRQRSKTTSHTQMVNYTKLKAMNTEMCLYIHGLVTIMIYW
jgi:hypothetical protein